jgi:hypothetical protein
MRGAVGVIKNEQGMAMIETVALLVIFVILLSFGMGFFGVVHTAILNSIAARAYAFETFRSRTNLNYYREDGSALDGNPGPLYLGVKGFRYHAIQHETDSRNSFIATTRAIAMGRTEKVVQTGQDVHNGQLWDILPRNQKVDIDPVWIMVGYGICVNAGCGQ